MGLGGSCSLLTLGGLIQKCACVPMSKQTASPRSDDSTEKELAQATGLQAHHRRKQTLCVMKLPLLQYCVKQ